MKKTTAIILTLLLSISLNSLKAQTLYPKKKGKKYIYVDANNKRVFKQKFDAAKRFYNDLAAVKIDEKWGYINKKGEVKIPVKFDAVGSFYNEYTFAEEQDKYFIIDKSGATVSPAYDSIYRQSNIYISKKEALYGILDSAGTLLVEPKLEGIGGYFENKLTVKLDNIWGSWKNGVLNFEDDDLYFSWPEQAPIYSKKCAKISDDKERKNCSDMAMLRKVFQNINYPPLARENGIQGIVIVQFIINKNGETTDHKLLKKLGYGCDQESLRVAKNYLQKWHQPGMQDKAPVNTIFNLPIRFKLH